MDSLKQIIEEINKDVDDTLDDSNIIGWVNRCIDDLTTITKKEEKKIADISSLNAYEVPDNVSEIVLVKANDEVFYPVSISDSDSKGYKVWGNVVSLQFGPENGVLELYYYRQLNHVATVDDVPEIDSSFFDLFVLYTVAHNQFAEDEPERQMDAMARYNNRKSEFENFVQKKATRFVKRKQVRDVYSSYWS